jgi:hypothetical protein
MHDVKFDGQAVRMGDKDLIIPPLTFKQLKNKSIRDKMKTMGTIGADPSDEQLNAARDVVMVCIQRNYSDLTEETLEEMLTMGNLRDCLRAVFGVEIPAGEIVATQQRQPTGTSSIAS